MHRPRFGLGASSVLCPRFLAPLLSGSRAGRSPVSCRRPLGCCGGGRRGPRAPNTTANVLAAITVSSTLSVGNRRSTESVVRFILLPQLDVAGSSPVARSFSRSSRRTAKSARCSGVSRSRKSSRSTAPASSIGFEVGGTSAPSRISLRPPATSVRSWWVGRSASAFQSPASRRGGPSRDHPSWPSPRDQSPSVVASTTRAPARGRTPAIFRGVRLVGW